MRRVQLSLANVGLSGFTNTEYPGLQGPQSWLSTGSVKSALSYMATSVSMEKRWSCSLEGISDATVIPLGKIVYSQSKK